MTDNVVELTLKLVDETAAEMKEVTKNTEAMAASFAAMNPELVKNKKEFARVVEEMKKMGGVAGEVGHAISGTTKETKELGKEFKATAKETINWGEASKETVKETDKLGKSLLSIGKGFIGVSGLFMLGRAIKGIAEDSLDAAREAGKLPVAFEEAEEAASRLEVAIGVKLGRTFEKPVAHVSQMKDELAESLEITERINQAVDRGLVTREEIHAIMVKSQRVMGIEEAVVLEQEKLDALELVIQREQERLDLIEQIKEVQETLTHAERSSGEEKRRAAFFLKKELEAQEGALEIARELAALTPIDFFADIDVDIAKKINAAIAGIEFAELGGEQIVQQFEDLLGFLDDPSIFVSPETIQAMLGDLETQAELTEIALAFQMGEIDLNEAKREIKEKLGGSFAEAEEILLSIINDLNALDNRRIQIFIDWQGEVPDIPGLGGGGGGNWGEPEPSGPPGGPGGSPGGGGPGGGWGTGLLGFGMTVGQINVTTNDPMDLVDMLVEELS